MFGYLFIIVFFVNLGFLVLEDNVFFLIDKMFCVCIISSFIFWVVFRLSNGVKFLLIMVKLIR